MHRSSQIFLFRNRTANTPRSHKKKSLGKLLSSKYSSPTAQSEEEELGENKNTALYSTHNSGKKGPVRNRFKSRTQNPRLSPLSPSFSSSLGGSSLLVPPPKTQKRKRRRKRKEGTVRRQKPSLSSLERNSLGRGRGEEGKEDIGRRKRVSVYGWIERRRWIFFAPSCPNGRHLKRECHLSFHASIERVF